MPNHFRAIGATTFLSPIPAVMLSCRGTEPGFDKDNLITVAWAGVINSAPPMISVSLRPSRHSYTQIMQSGVFCLNLINQPLCRAADFCGVKSGRDVDKFAEMGLHVREVPDFDAPALDEAPAFLCCRVKQRIPLGSHDLFLCAVEQVYVSDALFDENGSLHMGKAHLDEMKNGDKLYFASVESGNTTFSTNADGELSSADEIYSFKYSSQSEESDNLTYWFLTKSLGGTNENIALLRNAALASYSLASDLDRFHERRDEARYEEVGTGGLWARYRYSDIGRDNTFDMDKNMIQVGYDKEVSTADSRKIVGIAFDYTHADTDLTGISGSGSNDRYALNLYYSVLADCGGYADFTAKIGRLGSDYDLHNQAGQKIGSSFWQTFYGVSAEFGWRYALNDTFFIEPQTQLQIIRIEGDQFETDGGIKAQIADTNSIIGRIGLRAGSTFTLGSAEQKSTAYVFADALREFKGDYAFSAAGHSTAGDFSYSGKETWYDAGIGTNVALSSNINFRLNAKYIFGGVFESSRQIDAAIHFAF